MTYELFDVFAVVISLTAVFSFVNFRFLRLPTSIGVMVIAMSASLIMLVLENLGFSAVHPAETLFREVDFNKTLMQGMLSYLLFAGALHVDLSDLARYKWVVASMASFGVLISTVIIGILGYWVFNTIGLAIPFIYCLLFGALISPTDPIAVLAILRSAGVSKYLETKITGESLFNDGIGIVVFIVILGIATETTPLSMASIATLFLHEAIGGVVLGLAAGYFCNFMLRQVDNYQVEVLITLALVTGSYALSQHLHVSGPIAVVIAGLLLGNHGRRFAMSEKTQEHLDLFWELVDEILNAILFTLIGIELLVISIDQPHLLAGVAAIGIVLGARFISVMIPVWGFRQVREFEKHTIKILTWGGLRGGISVALALSLPPGEMRDSLLAITYCVVVFSILVQGLSIGRLVRWAQGRSDH
jgi:CPA1 family monovalent cation:H+ antiporter